MQKIIALVVCNVVLCFLCGCILIPVAIVGGAVVGGMAISEDTVQNEFDNTYDQVWDASVAAVDKVGGVELKDKQAGKIVGHVKKAKVTVRVEQLTAATVRIQVKARKSAGVLPDIDTAHRIGHEVAMTLKPAAAKEAPPAETSTEAK